MSDLVFALRTEKEKTNVDFVSGNIHYSYCINTAEF